MFFIVLFVIQKIMCYIYNVYNRQIARINMRKTLLIDLDGVLNDYVGNYDKNFIPPIKVGAKEFFEDLSKNYQVKIFTTRDKNLASKWISENGLSELIVGITNVKEPCWVYVDDRCITFDGNFEGLIDKIDNFKPYYKCRFSQQ